MVCAALLCMPGMMQAWQRYKSSQDEQDATYDDTLGARWGEDKHRDVQTPIQEDSDMRDIQDSDHTKVRWFGFGLGWD